VSDFTDVSGVSEISQFIDSEDYTFGQFVFGDLELTGLNVNGKLNGNEDDRSIFQFRRDQAKVKVNFETEVTTRTGSQVDSYSSSSNITFTGLINDEATRDNLNSSTVSFRVITLDSIIRTSEITAGQISNGDLASDVIKIALNKTEITNVLNFDPADINVDFDFVIDDGTFFDNISAFDALQSLLPAANSILIINSSNDIIVSGRTEDLIAPVLELFGENEIFGRNNILSIDNLNNGFHRMFNSIKISTTESSDQSFIDDFGLRQKEFTFDYVTDTTVRGTIATRLLDTFKVPKQELEVTIPLNLGQSVVLLQRVTIDAPLRVEPATPGVFLPVFAQSQYSDVDTPYAKESGSFSISPTILWKVIEIRQDLINFVTILKLREAGTTWGDGVA